MRHTLDDRPETQDEFNGQEEISLHRRRRVGVLGWCSVGFAVLLALAVAGAGLFIWNIQRDRNSAFLRQHFMEVLKAGLGPDNQVMLDEAGIRLAGVNPTFSVWGLAVANPQTGAYAQLDRADFGLSKLSLWRLSPEAKSIRFEGLRLVVPGARDQANPLAANEALTLLRAVLGAVQFAISGQDASFNTLGSIEGKDISILRRESDGKTTLLHSGLLVSVIRQSESVIMARVSKAGLPGALEFRANSAAVDGGRVITVETEELTAAGLSALLGMSVEGIDPRLKLLVRLHSRISADNVLQESGVSLAARGGHIIPPDTDMVPFDLDEAALDLRVRAGSSDVLIDRLQVRFNETNILARGTLAAASEGRDIQVQLQAERGELDRLSAGEPPLALDQASLEGTIAADLRSFTLTRLAIREDEGTAVLSGRFSLENDGTIETQIDTRNFDLRKALRVWPIWIAPNVRRWLVEHARSGTLAALSMRSSLSGEALRNAFNRRPIPDTSLGLTYRLENMQLRPVFDAAPINGLVVSGVSSGRHARIDIESGWIEALPKQRFEITNAQLVVADTARRPASLEMSIPAAGRLPGLLAFLSAPSLKSLVGLPPEAAASDGTFEGKASITMPIMPNPTPKDTRVDIRMDTRNVVIDNIIKGEKLEGGAIAFVSKSGQVSGKGEGRILGVPSQIEFRSDPGKTAEAIVKASLDEAMLARRGIPVRSMVTGPIAATFTIPFGKSPGVTSIDVDLDLARTKIETGIPGISKRADQPGRAKFSVLTRPEGTVLNNFEYDVGTSSFRGKIDLTRDGQLGKAEFSSFKVSPGDNARLNIERVRGVTRLTLRGNSFDMRPFLRGFQSGKINADKAGDSKSGDLDLDLQSTVLVGFNGELMSAVEAAVSQRGGRVSQLALKGQFAGVPVSVVTSARDAESTLVVAETADGGGLVRFLDIYPRIFGGKLTAELSLSAQSQQGVVQIRNFVIRGEPSLRQVGATARSPGQVVPTDDDAVSFTKFRAEFVRRPGRLDVQEAVMWGGQVGGSIDGVIDYANDRVNLKGAFVPAYALNNLFAQVPLLGPLLGGGQYEGLFAVPFIITGKASAPVLRTNPVSAIAPGFLRKIFEIRNNSR